jgi:hypothetical protein
VTADNYQAESSCEGRIKRLCNECTGLFELIKNCPLPDRGRFGESRELLTSLKTISHCVKRLVGMWLQSAMLEPVLSVDHFSMGLMMSDLMFYRPQMLSIYTGSSNICVECCCAVDGQCFREYECSWHVECLRCTYCQGLAAFLGDVSLDSPTVLPVLPTCRFCGYRRRTQHVTMLSQRRHLLWRKLAQLMSSMQLGWDALPRVVIEAQGPENGAG